MRGARDAEQPGGPRKEVGQPPGPAIAVGDGGEELRTLCSNPTQFKS